MYPKTKLRLALLAILLPLSIAAFSQRSRSKKSSDTPVQFGVSLSVDYARWRFEATNWEENGLSDELGSVKSQKGLGFSLGVQSNFSLGEVWLLRLEPQMCFSQKVMTYNFHTDNVKSYNHNLVGIALPIDFIYRFSEKSGSPSIVFGGWSRYNFKSDKVPEIVLQKLDFGVNIGFGVDFPTKKYTFRPELLLSVGLKNSFKSESIFRDERALDAIYRDRIALRFNFFG